MILAGARMIGKKLSEAQYSTVAVDRTLVIAAPDSGIYADRGIK
jgi:hypothetical protein